MRELNFFNKFKMLFFWLGYLVIMKVWEWLVVIISNVLLLFVIFLVIWIVLLNIMVFDKVMVVWEVWWLWFIWFFLWKIKKRYKVMFWFKNIIISKRILYVLIELKKVFENVIYFFLFIKVILFYFLLIRRSFCCFFWGFLWFFVLFLLVMVFC